MTPDSGPDGLGRRDKYIPDLAYRIETYGGLVYRPSVLVKKRLKGTPGGIASPI